MKSITFIARTHWKFGLLLILVAITAAVMLVFATGCRPGLNADSITYLSMADQFLSGNGFSRLSGPTGFKPITIHPPFYPFMLAITQFLGLQPLNGALILNAVAFFINVILVGVLLRKIFDSNYLPVIGALLFSLSPVSIEWHSWAFSEPLYVALSLLCFYFMVAFTEKRGFVNILIMGMLVGMAMITRYIAVSLFFTIAVVIFLVGSSLSEKLILLSTFGLLSVLPVGLWVARNIHLTGAVSGHVLGLHVITHTKIKMLLNISWEWFIGTEFTFRSLLLYIVFAFVILMAVVYRLSRNGSRVRFKKYLMPPTVVTAMVIYTLCFCLFMVLAISTLDFNLSIDLRHLFPIYPFVFILLYVSFFHGASYLLSPKIARIASPMLVITLFTAYIVRDIPLLPATGFEDRGYGQIMAQHEYGHEEIARLPADTLIYTNNLELLYLLYDRGGYSIPEPWNPIRNEPNTDYAQRIERVRERILEESAVLLFFNPGEGEIVPMLVEGMVVYQYFGNEILYGAP